MNVTKPQNGTELIAAVEGRLDTLTSPEFEQEMNLKYVAITRARKELIFVDLKEGELTKQKISNE